MKPQWVPRLSTGTNVTSDWPSEPRGSVRLRPRSSTARRRQPRGYSHGLAAQWVERVWYGTYDACKRKEFVSYFAPDERARSPIPQVKSLDYLYISKYDLFCKHRQLSTCVMYANGEPAFYDEHHLSMGFAQYMGDRIVETHGDDLARIGLPVPLWIQSPNRADRSIPAASQKAE